MAVQEEHSIMHVGNVSGKMLVCCWLILVGLLNGSGGWRMIFRDLHCMDLSDISTVFELVEYVIMPNHIHGIIAIVGAPLVGARTTEIDSPKRADTRPAPTTGLGDIVGAFKSKLHIIPVSCWEGKNACGCCGYCQRPRP